MDIVMDTVSPKRAMPIIAALDAGQSEVDPLLHGAAGIADSPSDP